MEALFFWRSEGEAEIVQWEGGELWEGSHIPFGVNSKATKNKPYWESCEMWLRCLCWFPYRALKMTQKQADLQICETFRLYIEPSHFTSDHSFSLFCCVLQKQWCTSMFPDHILGNFSFCPKSSKMRIPCVPSPGFSELCLLIPGLGSHCLYEIWA